MSDLTTQQFSDQEYLDCLNLYHTAIYALTGMKMPYPEVECFTGLTSKIYFHAASLLTLSQGTVGPNHNFADHQSIIVLSRAIVETYAQLFHLFLAVQDQDQRNFRFNYFCYRGIKLRQEYKTTSTEGKAIQDQERLLLTELRNVMRNNSVYQQLKSKDRMKVDDGAYQVPSITQLIKNALRGVPEESIPGIYGYLSDA